MIIIVFGLPGSGKSYFASRLAARLNAAYLSTDEIRFKLFPERTYSEAEKHAVYNAMFDRMVRAIPDKKPIVLDGTFHKEQVRNKFEEAAKENNEKLIYIEVTAPEQTIKERLKKTRKNSEADFDVYLKLRNTIAPLDNDHLVLVSTHDNIEEMLDKALHYIDLSQ
jgi:predicted kinase